MKQCFGYVRVSTVKQGEGVSLIAQREAIEGFAARNNILISKWFEEKETAAKCGRPIFNRMVSDLKQRKADGLVIHKIDRSARNFSDWAKIGDLADAGIGIHFATETLDFDSRGGRLTADIQAVIAADFIRNLREEAIKGQQGRLKQGLYPFKAPFGYLDNGRGKPKTIDSVYGPMVKQLFELYATGNYSLWELRKEAKSRGLNAKGGQPLSKTSIEKILRNPFYMGVIKIKRTGKVYEGIHEVIVTPVLFDQVTAVRTGRDNKKTTKHQHRYRGIFRCGYCVGAMIPELQKGRVYYRCHLKKCKTKTIREDQIEDALKDFLKRYSLTNKQTASLREKFLQYIDDRDGQPNMQQAELELAKLDKRLSRLEDKLIDEIIDDDAFERKKSEIIFNRKRWTGIATRQVKKDQLIARLDKFLELTKNLYATYLIAAATQKREIVKFATSNCPVFTKNIVFEPSKWVQCFENALNLECCEVSRDSYRTFATIEELLEQVDDEEIQALYEDVIPLMQNH